MVQETSFKIIGFLINSGDESEEEPAPEPVVNTDLEALNSLTGNPLLEDELLFAVPVVAPYNAVQNYK